MMYPYLYPKEETLFLIQDNSSKLGDATILIAKDIPAHITGMSNFTITALYGPMCNARDIELETLRAENRQLKYDVKKEQDKTHNAIKNWALKTKEVIQEEHKQSYVIENKALQARLDKAAEIIKDALKNIDVGCYASDCLEDALAEISEGGEG